MGLYYNRMRYYDARLGRFTQRDLVFNPSDNYRYALNMPTQFSDPLGLLPPGPGNWILIAGYLNLNGDEDCEGYGKDKWGCLNKTCKSLTQNNEDPCGDCLQCCNDRYGGPSDADRNNYTKCNSGCNNLC